MLTDKLFDGKYKILEVLGSGGMSTVYLAQNIKLGTLWAIKEINLKTNPKIDLFVEPNILKKLNHPALPRIFDIVEDEENLYVIVDYIEGIALDKELKQVGAFDEGIVLEWTKQLCGVLNYLHTFKPNPIIYRDMKPSNIILSKNGSLKLIDFGIAREYKQDGGNDTVYIGTRGYAAPEQYGNMQTNASTDIYSLGITIIHLLTGIGPNEKAFEKIALEYGRKNTTTSFESIISKCIQLNSADRYQSIQELLDDINIYEQGKSEMIINPDVKNGNQISGESAFNRVISFNKLVLSVWGNSEFASEIAFFVSKLTDYLVLVINLDFLSDGIKNYMNLNESRKNTIYEFGFNEVINEAQKGKLSREMIMSASYKREDLQNLYILKSNFDINNYEFYKDKNIEKLIDAAYKSFDLIILNVNKSIFDEFTVKAFIKSNYVIAPIRGDIEAIKDCCESWEFVSNYHDIAVDKIGYVAYEYRDRINLPIDDIKNEVEEENYLGTVSYCSKREIYRNIKAFYAKRLDAPGQIEYRGILAKFNVVPKVTYKDKLKNWFFVKKKDFSKRKGKVVFH